MGTLRGFDQFMNLVINNTVEVNGEEENEICMVVKYEGFLEEKYGKEHNKHPKFDKDLWSRAEGKNKGKVYGLGNDSDPCVHSREDPKVFNRIQPSLSCFIAVWIGYDGIYYNKYRKGSWPLIFHFALVLLDRKVERDYPSYSERKRKVEQYYCRIGGGKREIRRRKRL
ncbi:putative sm-like protein Lsm7/SmG [Helianthus annuus]|nr:putative sm-like protein Lsm7/SmG [Helianthus annuus]